jgi:hypothetical protein
VIRSLLASTVLAACMLALGADLVQAAGHATETVRVVVVPAANA